MNQILFVTGNENKAREILAILDDERIVIRALDVPEIQSMDIEEIVRNKVAAACDIAGQPVMVEDVSFELGVLNGFPGPFVKFWEKQVGYDLVHKVAEMSGDCSARIRCGIGFADGERVFYTEATIDGKLVARREGEAFGFGFYFLPDGHDQTFSEMGRVEKSKISHRKMALEMMRKKLKEEGIL